MSNNGYWVDDHGFRETSPGSERCKDCPYRMSRHMKLGESAPAGYFLDTGVYVEYDDPWLEVLLPRVRAMLNKRRVFTDEEIAEALIKALEALPNKHSPKLATDNDAKSVVGGGEDGK